MVDEKRGVDRQNELPMNVEFVRNEMLEEVKHPICNRFFDLFRILGTVIAAGSLVADFTYV